MVATGGWAGLCWASWVLTGWLVVEGAAVHQRSGESLTPGTSPRVCEHPASRENPATATAVAARHVILM
ncbi:hypothetical protein [Cutibacterium avidum]|uniref:hypothetical protein n=1 Tax=Cutibacterium avidum TaxID=33010 RepID=UPI001C84B46A|nr:hypothetical protein [Cutibacterium avidum]